MMVFTLGICMCEGVGEDMVSHILIHGMKTFEYECECFSLNV